MSRERGGREDPDDAAVEARSSGAPGRRSLVANRYPALGQALGSRGGDEPTIHDAAGAAVDHKDGGAALDTGVADRVGAHLGADFSAVRVHSDPLAREATQAMGARAFAHGSDIFLGPRESGSDLGLMAHELTHVAQQGAAGQRLPQRAVQVGEADSPAERQADRVAADVTGGKPAAVLLVDDPPVATGQMLKRQFLDQLRVQVGAATDADLGPEFAAIGCPPVEQFFSRSATEPAAASEARFRRLAPSATTAADLFPGVVARIREGVRAWRDTGRVPPELAAIDPVGAAAATSTAPQAQALRAPDGRETLASLEAELGPGRPLDAGTASRMSDALGVDVSDARIHTGATAARKADDAGALAFAVGSNVVMSASAPAAGTLEGDALLAHELAHTAQQAGAASDPVARRQPIGGESAAAEEHADEVAAGAMGRMHGGWAGRLGGMFRTGLQLQRCPPQQPQQPSIRNYANPATAAHDPGRLSEQAIRATIEFRTLVADHVQNQHVYTEDDAVLACRLAIRTLRDGQALDLNAQAVEYLRRAHDQRAAAGGAEGEVGQLNWVQYNSGQAVRDPSQLQSEFSRWLLSAQAQPSPASGRMNCWELVMFGAFRAGVIGEDALRAVYTQAVENVRTGRYQSVGQTFEEFTRGSAVQTFRLNDGTSPLPLRGDIVVFRDAPAHACIALGGEQVNPDTGQAEHPVVSLWTPSGGHVERTTIEALAGETDARPIRFWSARWR